MRPDTETLIRRSAGKKTSKSLGDETEEMRGILLDLAKSRHPGEIPLETTGRAAFESVERIKEIIYGTRNAPGPFGLYSPFSKRRVTKATNLMLELACGNPKLFNKVAQTVVSEASFLSRIEGGWISRRHAKKLLEAALK